MKCERCGKNEAASGTLPPTCHPCAIAHLKKVMADNDHKFKNPGIAAGIPPDFAAGGVLNNPKIVDPCPTPKFKAGDVVTGDVFSLGSPDPNNFLFNRIHRILFDPSYQPSTTNISDCFKGSPDPFRL